MASSSTSASTQPALTAFWQVRQHLDETLARLNVQNAPQLACKPACAGCCIDGFRIRYAEAVELLRGFAELPPETASQLIQNLTNAPTGQCPLLIENTCSLYTSRPSLCRAFGQIIRLGDKLATCELNFQGLTAEDSPETLDLQPYYAALDTISTELWAGMPASMRGSLPASAEPPLLSMRHWFSALLGLVQAPPVPAPGPGPAQHLGAEAHPVSVPAQALPVPGVKSPHAPVA